MGDFPHGRPRVRLKALLERDFRGSPGRLAREIGCTPKAAENLLNGHWPNDITLARIVCRFGKDVFDACFGPDLDATLAKLQMEEAKLARQLEAASARRRQVEGRPRDGDRQLAEAASAAGGAAE